MRDQSILSHRECNTLELAWAAGFFDAEGHTGLSYPNRTSRSIAVSIKQIHPEPLHRFRDAVGVGSVTGPNTPKQENYHPQWSYSASGGIVARIVVDAMQPWLGETKRIQANTVIDVLDARGFQAGAPTGEVCSKGHDLGVYGYKSGACRECNRLRCLSRYYVRKGDSETAIRVLAGEHISNRGWRRTEVDSVSLWVPRARPNHPSLGNAPRDGIDEHAAAWAAGFFDGEGTTCFSQAKDPRQTKLAPTLRLSVPQNDPLILERFRSAVGGVGVIHGPMQTASMKNPRWTWCTPRRSDTLTALDIMWPHLSSPKREQAIRAYDSFMSVLERPGRRPKSRCVRGHDFNDNVIRSGKRVCRQCEQLHGRAAYFRRIGRHDLSEELLRIDLVATAV